MKNMMKKIVLSLSLVAVSGLTQPCFAWHPGQGGQSGQGYGMAGEFKHRFGKFLMAKLDDLIAKAAGADKDNLVVFKNKIEEKKAIRQEIERTPEVQSINSEIKNLRDQLRSKRVAKRDIFNKNEKFVASKNAVREAFLKVKDLLRAHKGIITDQVKIQIQNDFATVVAAEQDPVDTVVVIADEAPGDPVDAE